MMPLTRKNRRRLMAVAVLATATLGTLAANPAFAETRAAPIATASPLAMKLTVQRVLVDAQGHEQFVEASEVRPGDLLEYRSIYTNRGARALSKVEATLPVPTHTRYEARSAWPAPALASRGDAQYAAEPLMQRVRDASGNEVLKAVPLAQYRSLRWSLDALQPGQSVTVRARMRVDADAPPAAASAVGVVNPASTAIAQVQR